MNIVKHIKFIQIASPIFVALLLFACGGGGAPVTPPASFIISGTVTNNGVGLSGVTMILSGRASGTSTTDTGGNYLFANVGNGNYAVDLPSTGFASQSMRGQGVTVSGANVTGVNFSGVAPNVFTPLALDLKFNDPGFSSAGFALANVVLDTNAVYWFDYNAAQGFTGGALRSVPKSGGAVTVLASGLGGVNAFAVDGTALYWTEFNIGSGGGSVKKVSKSSGAVTVLATGFPMQENGQPSPFDVFFPGGIALDANFVYWSEGVGGSAIRRVPKAGGPVVDIGRGQGFSPALSMDASFFYGTNGPSAARMPIAGGTVEILASGLNHAISSVLDGGFLYWAELTNPGKIARVSATGGTVTVLAQNIDNPHNVVVDNSFAYYLHNPGGATLSGVWRVPKAGGTPTIVVSPTGLAGNVIIPFFVAVDDTSVYISTYLGGIFKAPK